MMKGAAGAETLEIIRHGSELGTASRPFTLARLTLVG
jgi:hypothetical protein